MIISDNTNKSKWQIAISLSSLFQAANQCFRGVQWKENTIRFKLNLWSRIIRLQSQLESGKYKLTKYTNFKIYFPKERQVYSTALRDRIIQKSLCNNGLYEMLTKSFIYDNCACLKNRGVLFATNRLKTHMVRFYRRHKWNGFFLKLDIKKFFYNIPHWYVHQLIDKKLTDDNFKKYCHNLIDSFDVDKNGKGLILGSQISQLLALAVLDPLDHYIKEQLKIKHYVRYMDDLIIIHEDKNYLKFVWHQIENELNKINLKLNKKSTIIPLKNNLLFLQQRYKMTNTGRVIINIPRNKIVDEKRKLKKLFELKNNNKITQDDIDKHLVSWLSKCKHTNSNLVEKEIMQCYLRLQKTN